MRTEALELPNRRDPSMPTARDILAILFRQRWAMAIAFVFVLAAVFLSGVWVPGYEAQMKILVQRQRSDAIITSSAIAPTQFNSDQVSEEDLNSEAELLNSDDLLRRVVLTTQLGHKPGFPAAPQNDIDVAKAVHKLVKDLTIEPRRKSNVISVRYRSSNPQMAAETLNALSAAYTQMHLELHRSPGEFKFFDQQAHEYQQGLDDAQARLIEFTKKTGVVAAQLERDSALKQADEFDADAHHAQTTVVETEKRIEILQTELRSVQPRMTTVVRNSDNPQLQSQLKSTLLNLELKRTELLAKYEPSYRLVQDVDHQISDVKGAISVEEKKPIKDETTDQNPDYEWVRTELTKAQTDLIGLRARAVSALSVAVQYRQAAQRLSQQDLDQQDLLRAAKTQERNYLLYVDKREEARTSDALDQRGIINVALVERPVVPALPNRSPLNLAFLTLLLAGTVSFSTAVAVDFMDSSFRTPDELANYLGTPVLAALPKGGE
jgi:uncharacterized protein involved in exopolysaccharide biosynthesis